jgi:hypothetical protein
MYTVFFFLVSTKANRGGAVLGGNINFLFLRISFFVIQSGSSSALNIQKREKREESKGKRMRKLSK